MLIALPLLEDLMEALHIARAIQSNNYYLLGKRRCLLYGFWSKNALGTPLRTSVYVNLQPKFVAVLAKTLILANIDSHGSWNEIRLFA
jgi:hypothetical protein